MYINMCICSYEYMCMCAHAPIYISPILQVLSRLWHAHRTASHTAPTLCLKTLEAESLQPVKGHWEEDRAEHEFSSRGPVG